MLSILKHSYEKDDHCYHSNNQLDVRSSCQWGTFLGSAQRDSCTESRVTDGHFYIVFCTPESFLTASGSTKPLFRSLIAQKEVGLIAVDEARLIRTWRSFR